jgi:hypothetical protein
MALVPTEVSHMNSGKDKDDRQRKYFQTYRSETKTLALTIDGMQPNGVTTFVNARIRIRKEDRRLPLIFYCAFEPDGGSPDLCIIATELMPQVTVRECVLLNRSYIPVVNRIGSTALAGGNFFPGRQGCMGFAVDISADCDAVDISLHLTQALGALDGGNDDGRPTRYGGRWICGYSLTCNDRLSQEEWNDAVTKCNMMCETFSDSRFDGVPVLSNNSGYPTVDLSRGTDVEGTGGVNIPNQYIQQGTGGLG